MSQRKKAPPVTKLSDIPPNVFREAVAQADIAISITDAQANILYVNPAFEKVTGYAAGEAVGKNQSMLLAILDAVRAELGHDLGPAHDGRQAFTDREIRIESAGRKGARWFSCTGTWVKSVGEGADTYFAHQDSIYLLLIAKEITQQRIQQEKARMAALQAMMSEENRISGLRESLSAALFQMEGPLNLLASVVAMQSRRGQNDPTLMALSEVLRTGNEALDSLRRVIPEPSGEAVTATNLNEILRDVLDLSTGRLLAAGISVSWKPQTVLPSIHGYPIRLRALFKALVDNALEAMNTKGWPQRELVVTTRSLLGSVEVLIEDSGPGIVPDLHLKAFEPFFTTKNSHQHAGTGLSMAQQVATDHGGTIEIDPAVGPGCRLRAVLPTRSGGAHA